ncbi:MAG: type II toxin-antitoxin system VapC family toxin [Nitrospirales bacterium]|nr:type II toxin-antitoxin system VapC family toxin [Nitrospirales bacterium]
MKLVDLNVLLYVVNETAVHHARVRQWWEDAINGDDSVGLPWLVLLGFLRLSTHPNIFPHPLDPATAIGKLDLWLSLDNTRVVREKEEHWEILRLLIKESGLAGNLSSDAHLAAMAISHGAILVSCDNDFSRFRGIRWENPVI